MVVVSVLYVLLFFGEGLCGFAKLCTDYNWKTRGPLVEDALSLLPFSLVFH